MITIFQNGGFVMFFVVGFGLVALGTALYFAMRPDEKHEGFIKWMGLATLAAILSGFCSDLATVAYHVANFDPQPDAEQRIRILLTGFYESMSPGILGFPLLSLAALATAVGRRRMDARAVGADEAAQG